MRLMLERLAELNQKEPVEGHFRETSKGWQPLTPCNEEVEEAEEVCALNQHFPTPRHPPNTHHRWSQAAWGANLAGPPFRKLSAVECQLGRVLINRQPNADLDEPPNVRYWGKADRARTCQYVRF